MVVKKKKGRGKFIAGCVCGIAILGFVATLNFGGFGFGDSWGFGSGSGDRDGSGYDTDGNGGSRSGDFEDVDDAQRQDENGGLTLMHLVIVEGERVLHNEDEISLAQLGVLLVNYSDAAWELRGERAIAAVYDDVKALFLEHGVTFTETMD